MHILEVTDEKKINTGRQLEIDIAKGLAVIFMILVHTQLYFSTGVARENPIGVLIDYLGGASSAVVFMFILGVGTVYTKKNNFRQFLKRGLILITMGYGLNVARVLMAPAYNEIYDVDILQFAGLATILLGAIKVLNVGNFKVALIALALAFLNLILRMLGVSDPSGLFYGSEWYSYFPFLSWIIFPLAGYIFGDLLIRCKSKTWLYLYIGIPATIIWTFSCILFMGILKTDYGWATDAAYYHMDIKAGIIFTAFTIAWISLFAGIGPELPKKIKAVFVRWSRNVTPIYIIQWFPICGLTNVIEPYSLGTLKYLLLVIGIIVICDILACGYRRLEAMLKAKLNKKDEN